jgi:dienelactone hydrolase
LELGYIVPEMAGRIAFALVAAAAAVLVAGVPSSRAASSSEIFGITSLGSGANEAWVIAPGGARSIVVFLHERGDPIPQNYLGWLDSLAAQESAVVFPRYESAATRTPQQMLRNVRAAVTRAERHLAGLPVSGFGGGPIKGVPVIVVGYGYGGTLAFYVAANSARWGLPAPKAVVSIFPRPGPFPGMTLPPLAHSTRVVLQVGDADTSSAKSAANDLWAAIERHPAARKRLVTVHSGGGLRADHRAPVRLTSAAVNAFWEPLDQIIYDVRGG